MILLSAFKTMPFNCIRKIFLDYTSTSKTNSTKVSTMLIVRVTELEARVILLFLLSCYLLSLTFSPCPMLVVHTSLFTSKTNICVCFTTVDSKVKQQKPGFRMFGVYSRFLLITLVYYLWKMEFKEKKLNVRLFFVTHSRQLVPGAE